MVRNARDKVRSVSVVPSETDAQCWCWVVHGPRGEPIARSNYAYASRTGAWLAGECQKQETVHDRPEQT